jgi:hypothetical protein
MEPVPQRGLYHWAAELVNALLRQPRAIASGSARRRQTCASEAEPLGGPRRGLEGLRRRLARS